MSSATNGPASESAAVLTYGWLSTHTASVKASTGHGKRRRSTSGNVVSATSSNASSGEGGATTPNRRRRNSSGTSRLFANVSCKHANPKAPAATMASTAQSVRVMATLCTRYFFMSPW